MASSRDKELEKVLKTDSYEFTVVFTRHFSDDMEILESEKSIGEALLHQFVVELQTAYDETGMAGSFSVVSGPSVSLRKAL